VKKGEDIQDCEQILPQDPREKTRGTRRRPVERRCHRQKVKLLKIPEGWK